MMRSRKQKNLLILAEDSNTSRLAEGFLMHFAVDETRCKIHKYARGWSNAAEIASALQLNRNNEDYVLLLIDFDTYCQGEDVLDKVEKRKAAITKIIGDNISADRLFILGARTESEVLKRAMHAYFGDSSLSYEDIGNRIADECLNHEVRVGVWGDGELLHNMEEIVRLEQKVKPFLIKRR